MHPVPIACEVSKRALLIAAFAVPVAAFAVPVAAFAVPVAAFAVPVAAFAVPIATSMPTAAQSEPEPVQRLPLPTSEEIASLPPDGGPDFNRLVFEQSPYLLQHARNPVDWYAWGDEAFERARVEDKPVFLSIGYSTCHWCHVMEHESFEDAEVAQLMNEHFVCVKVDREERPDIDQVYMTYTQALTGRGGWPMTVLLTPEKKPFFAGTYFPKKGRSGMPGMMDLVPGLARQWQQQRDSIVKNADQAVAALKGMSQGTPGALLDGEILERAYTQLSGAFDAELGGFGQAPKFPIPHQLSFLLRHHLRTGEARALEMVETTLREMRKGGIWDHVGYGFHRYSTDPRWLVPHFEKMLYDQALMATACVETWQVTGDDAYREIAERIFDYVLRDMTAPKGGFYSAEDADSEGEEGLFYVWTPAELEVVLGAADAKLAALWWNASADGNFREEATGAATGRNILHQQQSLDELAATLELEPDELAQRLEVIRARLFTAREARVHPLKDDKILTDWNGLMIAALAKAARAFDAPEYEAAARRAADFALLELRDDDGRLFKRHRNGSSSLHGMLEDYAFLVWGLLELYETSFETRYLQAARELADSVLERFEDETRGGFFLSPEDGEALIVRTKETYDGALPSGNSVMAVNLLRLGRITTDARYEEAAEDAIRAFAGDVGRNPSAYTMLLAAADFAVGPTFEIVVAGERESDDTQAMLSALAREFLPNKVVVFRPAGPAPAELVALAPYAEAQVARDGAATAYVCRNFTCNAPTGDVELMLRSIRAPEGAK